MLGSEILRVVRHGVAPLVIIAVEQGWLPKAAQKDAIEFTAIIVSFALAWGWSAYNEHRRDLGKPDPE